MFRQTHEVIMESRKQHEAAYKRLLAEIRNRPRKIQSAPLLAREVMNIRKVEEAQFRMAHMMASNLDKLKNIHLSTSVVDDFLTKDLSHLFLIAYRNANNETKAIQEENKRLGSRLKQTTSVINTHLCPTLRPPNRKRSISDLYKVPSKTLNQYRTVVAPEDVGVINSLLRPCVFFELRPLGHIKVQLFTEACPEMVLQFVRICTHKRQTVFKINHIFPDIFVSATLQMDEDMFKGKHVEYDMDVLDFSKAGVFSFDMRSLSKRSDNRMQFSVTLKPLPVLNGEHIPFGLVTQGHRFLEGISDFGTKKGKLKKELVIAACGMAS